MARALADTSPARGHLYPLTPILDELSRRGHKVALRTLASEVEMMRARGIDAAPIEPAIEAIEHDDYEARTPLGGLKRVVRVLCRRAEHDARDLERAIDEERPDVVLVDIATWGALAIAERWGGPWAAWCPYPLPLPSRDAPPFGPGLPPARGWIGRLRDAALRPLVFSPVVRTMLPPVNEVRERVGLPPHQEIAEMFSSIPLLLYMTAEPFEYPRSDWPENVRLVGPCDWDPPAELPAGLEELARSAIRTPRADPRSRRLRGNPRRHGYHPEGARAGRSGLRRPLRARSARGRAPRRGGRSGNAASGQAPYPKAAARRGQGGDASRRGGAAGRRGLSRSRRRQCGRQRNRGAGRLTPDCGYAPLSSASCS